MCELVCERLRNGGVVDERMGQRFWRWSRGLKGDGSGGEGVERGAAGFRESSRECSQEFGIGIMESALSIC